MTRRDAALLVTALASIIPVAHADNWPQFRGVEGLGIAAGRQAPLTWDADDGTNIRWKTAIPGLGLSSPIVWGDRIYLTTAVPASGSAGLKVGLYGDIQSVRDDTPQSWRVLCIDRKNGAILWNVEACSGVPKIKRHTKCSHANSTAATDGKHVVAMFGAEGLYCFDAEGKLLWKKDLGVLDSGFFAVKGAQWGFGSSPVIHDGKLILQCDVQEDSFLAAYEIATGKELWRTPRKDVPSWGSPAIYEHEGKKRIAVNGWKHIGGYDFATGSEVWKLVGGGDIPVPTPIARDGLIYITNAHGSMRPLYAIRTSARGELTPVEDAPAEHVAWWHRNVGNYMQTPLIVGDLLYLCFDNGILSVYERDTGNLAYKQRLGGGNMGFTSSGVASGDRLYFTNESGDTFVVQTGREFKLLATNSIYESCMASPAVADGVLYLRGEKHLFAIAGTQGG